MDNITPFQTLSLSDLSLATGGEARNTGITGGIPGINNKIPDSAFTKAAPADGPLIRAKNAASGLVGGLGCLGKFVADGTPGTNSYDTYLACQRKAHQF